MKDAAGNQRSERWGQWMREAQAGDKTSYRRLLGEIQPVLLAFVNSRLYDRNACEDIVQEILIGIHHARHTFDSARSFAPWMFAIARYKLIDHTRKWKSKQSKEVGDEGVFETLAAEEEDTAMAELREELLRGMSKLPTKQRQIVEMLKIRGLSVKEASAETGMSESAVKVTAHRGYKALKKILVDD